MRILVLGDFSGRQNRGIVEPGSGLSGRPILKVDVDNFEEVLARLRPRLSLEPGDAGAPAVEIEFGRMDAFHPDGLYQGLDIFRALREIRSQLSDPATSAAVAAGLGRGPAGGAAPPVTPERPRGPGRAAPSEDDQATLARLLGSPQARRETPRVDITQFLRRIVGPYILPEADPRLPDLLAAVDEATTGQMRSLLHDPAFQALESVWRGLWWLVTGVETGEDLELHLLDVSREELGADFRAAGKDLEASGLFRLLVEGRTGTDAGRPWSLLVGDYTFGPEPREIEVLGALGAIAARSGGPLLAAGGPSILGCRSIVESPDPRDWTTTDGEQAAAWRALRASPMAGWLGLALPRVLLRLPYGRRTDAVDRFAFEELPHGADHATLLWGNPAFACALLIGRAFSQNGWSMQPGDCLDLGDLPAHTYEEDGERRMTPCAEVFLSERAGDAILSRGLMPLMSRRNSNAVRLVRFQSLADPPAALSGPWK